LHWSIAFAVHSTATSSYSTTNPRFNGADRCIVGVEALLRWRDPERGLVSPGEFLPMLESTGFDSQGGPVGTGAGSEDSRRWRHFDLPPVRVAVNVSTAELSQPGLAARFLRLAGMRNGKRS